jgi:uncharacterized protein YggE
VSLAGAADESGITVLGIGEVMAKPNLLEIEVRASGEAELTGDAVVKYDDSLRRIRGALAKLQMKELTVDERELNIASGAEATGGLAAVMAAQNKAPAKSNFHITRSLRLAVRNIDKQPEADVIAAISKLLDTAKDAGAAIGKEGSTAAVLQMMGQGGGPSSVAHFVVEHPEELLEKAYEKAFDEATARATRLAKLAHSRLGRAVSIEEVATAATKETGIQERMISAVYGIETAASDERRLSSDKLVDIPVRVTLRVRFELLSGQAQRASEEAAQAAVDQ